MHPGWEYRFWTDDLLLDFVTEHYAQFLPVFISYQRPVMRADAARYLLLHHYGGVYADIDVECVQNHDRFLENNKLMLPLEPLTHLTVGAVAKAGLKRLVGNAWMASEPGNPFWHLVIQELFLRQSEDDPLIATGPIMLTQLINRSEGQLDISLISRSVVYPASKFDRGWLAFRKIGSPHWFSEDTLAIHYWDGTWWRHEDDFIKVRLMSAGESIRSTRIDISSGRSRHDGDWPLVSCIVFPADCDLISFAIDCFLLQTYSNKELLIFVSDEQEALGVKIPSGAPIRIVNLYGDDSEWSSLIKIVLDECSGDFLCKWNGEQFSLPQRLEIQVLVLLSVQADACGVSRVTFWWPTQFRVAISLANLWQCGILWRRHAIEGCMEAMAYKLAVPLSISNRIGFAAIDVPELCLQMFTDFSDAGDEHNEYWNSSQIKSEGVDCRLTLQVMQHIVPCDKYCSAFIPSDDVVSLLPSEGSCTS